MNKPESFKQIPPGCCIALEAPKERDFYFSVIRNSFIPTEGGGIYRHTVLRPSAENRYGLLPWDIPLKPGYEPDGDWEGEKTAWRKVGPDDFFVDPRTGSIIQAGSLYIEGEPRLCVRRIKTKRMVVEIELRPSVKPFGVGEEVTVSAIHSDGYYGTITAVREVER